MKHSYQRDVILKEAIRLDHPSAEYIYESVRKKIPNVSLGTVYRNLKQLEEHNLIKKIIVNNNYHFDKTLDEHFHFYCSNCGSIYDVKIDVDVSNIPHRVNTYSVELIGVCQKCEGKE